MIPYDHEDDLKDFAGEEDLSDTEMAERALDTLLFARQFKYHYSLDPFDYCSPEDSAGWSAANQEIDRRIYFGLRLPR